MDNRAVVNNLFENISSQLGVRICLGENNLCSIKKNSTGEEYVVELSKYGNILYIYSPITEIPFENRENLFEFILKLNLHGIKTFNSIIGIDAKTNKFVLSKTLLIDGLHETSLLNAINEFAATMPSIKENIVKFSQGQATQATLDENVSLNSTVNFVV